MTAKDELRKLREELSQEHGVSQERASEVKRRHRDEIVRHPRLHWISTVRCGTGWGLLIGADPNLSDQERVTELDGVPVTYRPAGRFYPAR